MVTSAFINIMNRRAGAVTWDVNSGIGAFEYDPSFIMSGLDLSPFTMPLNDAGNRIFSFPELKNTATFRGLPGLVADVLPDKYGNAVIDAWLTTQGRPSGSFNPVEMLCFIGKRGMGALEFEPVIARNSDMATRIEVGSLVRVAENILTGKRIFNSRLSEKEEKALLDILKIGASAGGARAKAVITYNPLTNEVRSGQTAAPKGFSHWIIKFDGVSDSQFGTASGYGRVEMAYHLMARDAGIEMTECRLYEENGRAHFMTRRFDRSGKNVKFHTQTFCALRHFDYNEVALYSYEQLFETLRMLRLPYPQAEELYRRMVFNVMSRNCDDHTKNFSFIMDHQGKWRLSPAYDMCHAYRPDSSWVSQHGLSINGKRSGIQRDDLLAVAESMNVKKPESIIDSIAATVGNWSVYAKKTKVDKKLREAIGSTLAIL